jgi:hypothetical protein
VAAVCFFHHHGPLAKKAGCEHFSFGRKVERCGAFFSHSLFLFSEWSNVVFSWFNTVVGAVFDNTVCHSSFETPEARRSRYSWGNSLAAPRMSSLFHYQCAHETVLWYVAAMELPRLSFPPSTGTTTTTINNDNQQQRQPTTNNQQQRQTNNNNDKPTTTTTTTN